MRRELSVQKDFIQLAIRVAEKPPHFGDMVPKRTSQQQSECPPPTVRETVRAKLRVMVRRILRRYGYPPDKQDKATQTVLEQAEVIAKDWAG